MNCNTSGTFSVPTSFSENPENVKTAVEAANKALRNIHLLYNEIMTPKTDPEYGFDVCESHYTSQTHSSCSSQINSDRSKTASLVQPRSGLCYSCRKYVSFCDSCRPRKSTKQKLPNCEKSFLNNLEQNSELKNRLQTENETDAKYELKVTIPRPFSLTAENIKRLEAKNKKISLLKETLQKEEEKELKVKIHSKPVPKHVSQLLYGDMVQRNEKRKQQRKEKCLEILEKEVKPFNLTRSKSISDMPKESQKQFQAKPVPKHVLSENISKKLRDKEEIRKILIAHRAEEMLKQSSLPFSVKNLTRSYSSINLNGYSNKTNKQKPDIDAITKRLYSIKCKETLESWNNKVLDSKCDNSKNVKAQDIKNIEKPNNSTKSKQIPNNLLPYYNFPVRMSTAAALREKRIRSEIDLRQNRNSNTESIKQEFLRKKEEIIKNIWPRLKSAAEPGNNSEKEIEEKVKSFKASQRSRKQEYEKELDDMMKRVLNQFLLMERQSKIKEEQSQHTPSEFQEEKSSLSLSNHSSNESIVDDPKSEKSEELEKSSILDESEEIPSPSSKSEQSSNKSDT